VKAVTHLLNNQKAILMRRTSCQHQKFRMKKMKVINHKKMMKKRKKMSQNKMMKSKVYSIHENRRIILS
jgi:hypothetical protein